jgi:hypothetical protein
MVSHLQRYDDAAIAIGSTFGNDSRTTYVREPDREARLPGERKGHHVKARANPFRGILWGCMFSVVLWAVLAAMWLLAGSWIGGML